jgi:superfamily II DNA helicase RecQ
LAPNISYVVVSQYNLLFSGTHVLAITGTADDETQKVIIKGLSLKQTKRFYVSPKLRISVIKCKKQEMFTNLEWLIRLVKEQGNATPKSIIFCNGSLTDIAAVFNHMLLQLGSYAYFPQDSQTSPNCLVGIYHSLTLKKYKDRITKSFKGNGKKRIIIASSALSMGVNFPDVRYVIHWGPSRNMLDYHQQSGRGGRDNKPTQVLTIYYGQQISFCEENVKAFLHTISCYRIEAYKPFDRNITPVKPAHACCSNCAKTCKCSDGEMSVQKQYLCLKWKKIMMFCHQLHVFPDQSLHLIKRTYMTDYMKWFR